MSILSELKYCDACLGNEAINGIYCVDCFLILSETPIKILQQTNELAKTIIEDYTPNIWGQINHMLKQDMVQNNFGLTPNEQQNLWGLNKLGDETTFMTIMEAVMTNFKVQGKLVDLK